MEVLQEREASLIRLIQSKAKNLTCWLQAFHNSCNQDFLSSICFVSGKFGQCRFWFLRTNSKVVKSYFLDYDCFFFTRRYTGESLSSTEFNKWNISYSFRFSAMDFHMFPKWKVFLIMNSQTIVLCLFTLCISMFLGGPQCKRMTPQFVIFLLRYLIIMIRPIFKFTH